MDLKTQPPDYANQVLGDHEYPRGAVAGMPTRASLLEHLHRPTDIDWHRDLKIDKDGSETLLGVERTRFAVTWSDRHDTRTTRTTLSEAAQAIRNTLVTEVPGVAFERVVDHGSNTHADLNQFYVQLGQLPLLGVDIDNLKDHTPGHAFTDDNSLVFELKVHCDTARASIPIKHRIVLAKEHRVAMELERRFGPVSSATLARVPAFLRPRVPSWLDANPAHETLKTVVTPPCTFQVMSDHVVWRPSISQRAQWLMAHGYDHLGPDEQEDRLRREGPRVRGGIPLTPLVEGQFLVLELYAVRGLPIRHATYLGGALPYLRTAVEFRHVDKVTGANALAVARVCPHKCFGLMDATPLASTVASPAVIGAPPPTTPSVEPSTETKLDTSPGETTQQEPNTLLDIEDLATMVRVHTGAVVPRLTVTNASACVGAAACNKCRDLVPSLLVLEDPSKVYLHVDSHRSRDTSSSVRKALAILETHQTDKTSTPLGPPLATTDLSKQKLSHPDTQPVPVDTKPSFW